MPEKITIVYGTFSADIMLESLLILPLRNIKKLFRMLPSDWRNKEATKQLALWLAEAEPEALERWKTASEEYRRGWRAIPDAQKHSLDQRIVAVRISNRELTRNVKRSKTNYDRIVKIHTIFKGECIYEP